MSELGQRLRAARRLRNMSQPKLAELSGVKQQMISKLERGAARSTGSLVQLANILEVNPGWLATGYGEMELQAGGISDEQQFASMLDGLTETQMDLVLRLIDELRRAPRRPHE